VNTLSSYLSNFSYVGLGTMLSTGFQAGFYLIFATLLEPEVYGEMSYFIALAGIFSVVSRFGLNHSVTVYQAKKKSEIANQVNVLALITSGSAALILLPINQFAAVLCLGFTFFAMNQHNLLGLKKYKKYTLNAILKSVLIITIPILLYFIIEIPGILLGMAISNLLASSGYLKSLSRKVGSFQDIKKNYKVLVNNFGIDASTAFPVIIDKLLIFPLFGFVFVGLYQFNLQILFALGILPVILHVFLLSEASSGKTHKKITYAALVGAVILTVLAIFLAPIFINEFFPKFQDGVFGLQIMILALVPLTISSIFTARLQASESTKVGFSGVIRIASLMVLIIVLGELYGLVGLSFAVLFSAIIYASSLALLYYKSKN